jgi:hypothetical protein
VQAQLAIRKRVDARTVAAMKYYLPLVVFAGCGTILLAGHPNFSVFAFRTVLNAPFIVAASFLLTVAEVRVADDFLEYRRLIGWTRVPYNKIARCEKSWCPGLGYLTFLPSERRTSKLYFVSGRLVHDDPQRTELTTYVSDRMSGEPARKYQAVASHPNSGSQKSQQLCVIMGLLGVLGSLAFALVSHNSRSAPDLQQFPRAIALAETIFWKATSWPWGLITCAALVAEVVRLRYEKKAWMVSFVVGFFLGSILVQAVSQAAL